MYNLIDYLKIFKNRHFKNILLYNCEELTYEEVIETSYFTDDLYVLCYSNFLVSSLSIKTRRNRNIHVSHFNYIPLLYYDVIFSTVFNDKILSFIINNTEIKYFIYLNDNKIEIPGFEHICENVYIRNQNKILIDINKDFNDFLEHKNRIKEIDKMIGIDDNKSIQTETQKIIKNERKDYFEINIKNLVPIEIKYRKNNKRNIIDGVLAIKYVISSFKDVEYYNENIENIISSYSYIKTFIVFNGIKTFKYISNIKNVNNLIKLEEVKSAIEINEIFENIINHEYVFDLADKKIKEFWI
jgi:hypothetical protein